MILSPLDNVLTTSLSVYFSKLPPGVRLKTFTRDCSTSILINFLHVHLISGCELFEELKWFNSSLSGLAEMWCVFFFSEIGEWARNIPLDP
jgi:hypothetical protein